MDKTILRVAQNIQELAEKALRDRVIIRTHDDFEIVRLPEGFLDHQVIFLWGPGKDFPAESIPDTVYIIPLALHDQKAYLVEKQFALEYNPPSAPS